MRDMNVAVTSSATAEGLPEASFARQLESSDHAPAYNRLMHRSSRAGPLDKGP
ncbi:hypothetical protein D9M68_317440 [compost metagenome]